MAEFEATRHIKAHANRIFSIAEDSSRASSWMPRIEGRQKSMPDRNRIEWGDSRGDERSAWLEVRGDGRESDVTLHVETPESDQDMRNEVEEALRKLEQTATTGAVR